MNPADKVLRGMVRQSVPVPFLQGFYSGVLRIGLNLDLEVSSSTSATSRSQRYPARHLTPDGSGGTAKTLHSAPKSCFTVRLDEQLESCFSEALKRSYLSNQRELGVARKNHTYLTSPRTPDKIGFSVTGAARPVKVKTDPDGSSRGQSGAGRPPWGGHPGFLTWGL